MTGGARRHRNTGGNAAARGLLRQVVGHAFRVHALDAVQRVARGRHRLDRAAKAPADEDLERLRLFLLGRLILRLFAFLLRRLSASAFAASLDGFTASLGGLTGRRRVSRNARAGTRPRVASHTPPLKIR